MNGHWYVVANQKAVRVFTQAVDGKKLILVSESKNALADVKTKDLIRRSKTSGARSVGGGNSMRYSKGKATDPHQEAVQDFIRDVVSHLDSARKNKEFESLTIVAEPRFLGQLRSGLNAQLMKRVSKWVRSDLQKLSSTALSKKLL